MLKLDLSQEHGILSGKFDYKVYEVVRDMPDRRRWKDGKLYFVKSIQNIDYLLTHLTIDEKIDIESYEKRVEEQNQNIVNKFMPTEQELIDFNFKTKPFPYQLEAFNLGKDREYFGLLMEMGTGKTKVSIDIMAYKYAIGEIDTCVIIAPNGVHTQWINEQILIHLPDYIKYEACVYKSSMSKKEQAKYDSMFNVQDKLKIFAMNVEAFQSEKGFYEAKRMVCSGKTLTIVDESTRIKNPTAKRTKAVLALKDLSRARLILSGAPITRGLEDLYSQLNFLSEDILGFSSFYSFKNYYCEMEQIHGRNVSPFAKRIVGYRHEDELKLRLQGNTFRATKALLDIPEPLPPIIRAIELTPEQARIYRELKDNLVSEIESGKIVEAPVAITKLLRLQQVVCGHVRDEESGELIYIKNNRIQEVMNILEEIDSKVIIFSKFVPDILKLAEELKKANIGFVTYYGEVPQKEREQRITDFKTREDIKVFLAQPACASTGLNLQEASTMIFYSNDFNADFRWQAEARIHRNGQKNRCTYIDLVAPKTIDEYILQNLKGKKGLADNTLEEIKNFLKK